MDSLKTFHKSKSENDLTYPQLSNNNNINNTESEFDYELGEKEDEDSAKLIMEKNGDDEQFPQQNLMNISVESYKTVMTHKIEHYQEKRSIKFFDKHFNDKL